MYLTVKIDIGNAAMFTPWDLANALRKLADDFTERDFAGDPYEAAQTDEGLIWDRNGNRAGKWAIA